MTAPASTRSLGPFLASLGARGRRRAEPRLSIALAGAGCALAVVGTFVVAGDAGSGDGGSFDRTPGLVLSLLLVAVGALVLHLARRGPLATAGAVAAVLGVPAVVYFLTWDGTGDPTADQALVIVPTLVWGAAYLVGPGRGRPIFLVAALFGAWASLLDVLVDGGFGSAVGFLPVTFFGFLFFGSLGFSDGDLDVYGGPDFTAIGLLSLAVGAVYVLVSRRLDRSGHHGVATPFALVALPALAEGVVVLYADLELAGTGLVGAAVGVGLAAHGATTGRRATTWIGAGMAVVGLAVFLGDLSSEVGMAGWLFMVVGAGLVAAAHLLGHALDEPDEMVLTEGVRPLRRPPAAPSATPPAA